MTCADSDAFGDKKIAERYNQTDPQFEQTDTPKNVPQFFKPFPRDKQTRAPKFRSW